MLVWIADVQPWFIKAFVFIWPQSSTRSCPTCSIPPSHSTSVAYWRLATGFLSMGLGWNWASIFPHYGDFFNELMQAQMCPAADEMACRVEPVCSLHITNSRQAHEQQASFSGNECFSTSFPVRRWYFTSQKLTIHYLCPCYVAKGSVNMLRFRETPFFDKYNYVVFPLEPEMCPTFSNWVYCLHSL